MKIPKLALSCKLTAILGLAIYGLTACNGDGSGSTTTATPITPSVKNGFYIMQMGSGYDSSSHTTTSDQTCLVNASNPDNIHIANPLAVMDFSQEEEMSSLEKALNVDVSTEYGGGRFSGSVAAQYAEDSKDTSYTTNLLYIYRYAGRAVFNQGSLGQGFDALTPYAASIEQTDPNDFRTMCGDEYVSQMDAGAVLGVTLALKFNSHSDQKAFETELNGKVGLMNISAEIQKAASSSNVHVEMEIKAIQLGGEPQKLNDLFGDVDESGIYPFLNCETQGESGDVDACDLMISNIVAYGQSMGEQLTNSDGSINLENLYYTNPAPTSYSNLGITLTGTDNPSAEILAAMEQMTADYDKAVYDYNFTSHYMEVLADKMDSATEENLRDATQHLSDQINNVYLQPVYDVEDCYNGYVSTQCLDIYNNVQHALAKYQLEGKESDLIAYLENNSYSGELLNYYGGSTPTSADYHKAGSCILAPVSNPNVAHYAINCDGQWLTTANDTGVTVLPYFGTEGVSIKDLIYVSTPPYSTTNGQMISYPDTMLPLDLYYDDYYYGNLLNITAPGYSTTTGELGLVRLYENLA